MPGLRIGSFERWAALALVTGLAGCPRDPEFAAADTAVVDTVVIDTGVVDSEDAVDDTDSGRLQEETSGGDVESDTDASACEPPCLAGQGCFSGACSSCAFDCATVLELAQCGDDGCGGLCGCPAATPCKAGACACPIGGCTSIVSGTRVHERPVLGFDLRSHPFVSTRSPNGDLYLSTWDGERWQKDLGIGDWGHDVAGTAAGLADAFYVVHPSPSSETPPQWRMTRWSPGSEAKTQAVDLAGCLEPQMLTDVPRSRVLLSCIDYESGELRFYQLVGDALTPAFGPPIQVARFDNDIGELVVHDYSWSVDSAGGPQVATPRHMAGGGTELVLFTWATDHWNEEVITTVSAPAGVTVLRAVLAGEEADIEIFYTSARDGAPHVLRRAYRSNGWKNAEVEQVELDLSLLEARADPLGGVHLVRVAGAFATYQHITGGVIGTTLPHEVAWVGGVAVAFAADGMPAIAWAPSNGLSFMRLDEP